MEDLEFIIIMRVFFVSHVMALRLIAFKESLVEFCKENKLEWVEDPTNSQPVNCRNVIRHFLKDYPELSQGIGHIRETCFDFKMKLHDEGRVLSFHLCVLVLYS